MDRINSQLHSFKQALDTLGEAYDSTKLAVNIGNDNLIRLAHDGIIQRFEYCYDGFWKFLMSYLTLHLNETDIRGPKSIFRATIRRRLCTEEQGWYLVQMVDDRNETTHSYDYAQTREVLKRIKGYYLLMSAIITRVERHIEGEPFPTFPMKKVQKRSKRVKG